MVLISFGCKDQKETEFLKEQEQEQRKEKGQSSTAYSDLLLEMDTEKIMLLSILKKYHNIL